MTSISMPSHRGAHRGPDDSLPQLLERYREVRRWTEALTKPLEVEDCVVSSMADVSPTKWHLAHTSWFFETFVLSTFVPGYQSIDERYAFLFNSYYVQAGERHCRAQRGLVTRPTLTEVFNYRRHVDDAMCALLHQIGNDLDHPAWRLIELGINHEQQHQELLLMDIKHVFWTNPLRPAYREVPARQSASTNKIEWIEVPEGVHSIGYKGEQFTYDNETPAHRVFLEPSDIANRLITNAEYLEFINDGGYKRPELWLSAGFAAVQDQSWEAPLYWELTPDGWTEFTLGGTAPIAHDLPVCHVSYYEADAFARWANKSLPSEAAWEVASKGQPVVGRFMESGRNHPGPPIGNDGIQQLYGDVWQWTSSAYLGYPRYRPVHGAIGEYNGKWMADQWVLRGASCATPSSHARLTYRNFFPSASRWQFAGIRLAQQR